MVTAEHEAPSTVPFWPGALWDRMGNALRLAWLLSCVLKSGEP